jgi:hypothetical protein
MRRYFLSAIAVGALLGIPMLVLQRWVAETRLAAIALVIAWMVLVGIGLAIYVRRRRTLRAPILGAWLAIVAGTIAVGYLTGFRDVRVDEDVALAATRAHGVERERALAAETAEWSSRAGARTPPAASKPVELARGEFIGADGHAGTGTATVVERPGGQRLLTFTEFDVDPGIDVDVFLTASPGDVSDRIELGDLKGNIGDQQYEIPASADLGEYPYVILWCNPFTVRIAMAELRV